MGLLATAVPLPAAEAGRSAPALWQRTDTVGTELVCPHDDPRPGAEGTAVVAGPLAHTRRWHATLDADGTVRHLAVTCTGDRWSRTLTLSRRPEGWTGESQETGDLPVSTPPTGTADPAAVLTRADPAAVLRLGDAPIFVSWALRALALTPAAGPVEVPTLTVLSPSLSVVAGTATYHLVAPGRLRVTADRRSTTYDLTPDGLVAYCPGRLRLVR